MNVPYNVTYDRKLRLPSETDKARSLHKLVAPEREFNPEEWLEIMERLDCPLLNLYTQRVPIDQLIKSYEEISEPT